MSEQNLRNDVIKLTVEVEHISQNMSELVSSVKEFTHSVIRLEEYKKSDQEWKERIEGSISTLNKRQGTVEEEQNKRAWIVPLMTSIAILPAGAALGAIVKGFFG